MKYVPGETGTEKDLTSLYKTSANLVNYKKLLEKTGSFQDFKNMQCGNRCSFLINTSGHFTQTFYIVKPAEM